MKIELEIVRETNEFILARRNGNEQIKACKPFVKNTRGILIHRPRSACLQYLEYKGAWVTVRNHCGMSINGDKNLDFIDAPEDGDIVCQRCEDIAVERGHPTSSALAGKHVCTGGLRAYRNCCGETS